MTVPGKIHRAAIATCAVATATAVALGGVDGAARAQVADASSGGGFVASLTLTPQIVLSDRDEEGLTPRLGFGLSLSDITKSQALTLEATGGLQRSFGSGSTASAFDRPRLRAGYLYETRETAIGFDATYTRSDIDDTFADPTSGFLILDDGTRTDLSLGTRVEFGRDSPIGGVVTASRSYRIFDGASDIRNQDAVIDAAALSLIFRVDPRLDVTTGLEFRNVDADDPGTDSRTSAVRIGATAAATQTLTVDAGLSYQQSERSGGLRDARDERGLGFDVGLAQARPNGTLTARLSSGIGDTGRRTRLDFGRSLDLRDGTLSFGAGLVRAPDGGGLDPLYSFAYSKTLPSGEVSAALQQSYVSDIDGDEAINSTLSLGYTRQIGPLDQIRASYVLQDSVVQSGIAEDARRSEFGLTYSRTVTQDWALVAGYTYERDQSGGEDTTADNEVFVGIERTFTWRN